MRTGRWTAHHLRLVLRHDCASAAATFAAAIATTTTFTTATVELRPGADDGVAVARRVRTERLDPKRVNGSPKH